MDATNTTIPTYSITTTTDRAAVDATEEKSTSFIRNGTATTPATTSTTTTTTSTTSTTSTTTSTTADYI